jgi:hypothetical protein
MASQELSSPEVNKGCPLPPYNTLNFTSDSPSVFSTLVSYSKTQPQYPLPTGSSIDQLRTLQQNTTFYTALNQKTLDTKTLNNSLGAAGKVPYPQFRSESERLMYRQGLVMAAARMQLSGENPPLPAGVPVSTNYQIINS